MAKTTFSRRAVALVAILTLLFSLCSSLFAVGVAAEETVAIDAKMMEDYEAEGLVAGNLAGGMAQNAALVENAGGKALQFDVINANYGEFHAYGSNGNAVTGYKYLVMYMKQEVASGQGGVCFSKRDDVNYTYPDNYRYPAWQAIKNDGTVASYVDWEWSLGNFEGWVVLDLTSLSDVALSEGKLFTIHAFSSDPASELAGNGTATITLDNIFLTNDTYTTGDGLKIADLSITDYLAAMTGDDGGNEGTGDGGSEDETTIDSKMLEDYEAEGLVAGNLVGGDVVQSSAIVENAGGSALQFTTIKHQGYGKEIQIYGSTSNDITGYKYLVMYLKQEDITGEGAIGFSKIDGDYRHPAWTAINVDGNVKTAATGSGLYWGFGAFDGWIVIDLTTISEYNLLSDGRLISLHVFAALSTPGQSTITLDNIFLTNDTYTTGDGLKIAGQSITDYLAAMTGEAGDEPPVESSPLILQDFGSVDDTPNITVPGSYIVTGELEQSTAPGNTTGDAALKVAADPTNGWPQWAIPFNTEGLTAEQLSAYADGYLAFWGSLKGDCSHYFELLSETNEAGGVENKGYTYQVQSLGNVSYLPTNGSEIVSLGGSGFNASEGYEGWFIIKLTDFGSTNANSLAEFLEAMIGGGAFYAVSNGWTACTFDNICLFNSYAIVEGELIIDGQKASEVFAGDEITLTNNVEGVTVSPKAPVPGEKVTLTVDHDALTTKIKAGSLRIMNGDTVVAVPEREGFQTENTAANVFTFTMPAYDCSVEAEVADAGVPNMGSVGWQVRTKDNALRSIHRVFITQDSDGKYWTTVNGTSVEVAEFGVVIGTEYSDVADAVKGLAVEDVTDGNAYRFKFEELNRRYDVSSEYHDLSVAITGLGDHPNTKLVSRAYMRLADAEEYIYTEVVTKSLNEAAGAVA